VFATKWYVKIQVGWQELRERARGEGGASAVEYGLLVALIAAVIVLVVTAVGQKVSGTFEDLNAAYP
jgi:pilus assembly protein Flp/PilA